MGNNFSFAAKSDRSPPPIASLLAGLSSAGMAARL
jgi:hypothetical protein